MLPRQEIAEIGQGHLSGSCILVSLDRGLLHQLINQAPEDFNPLVGVLGQGIPSLLIRFPLCVRGLECGITDERRSFLLPWRLAHLRDRESRDDDGLAERREHLRLLPFGVGIRVVVIERTLPVLPGAARTVPLVLAA